MVFTQRPRARGIGRRQGWFFFAFHLVFPVLRLCSCVAPKVIPRIFSKPIITERRFYRASWNTGVHFTLSYEDPQESLLLRNNMSASPRFIHFFAGWNRQRVAFPVPRISERRRCLPLSVHNPSHLRGEAHVLHGDRNGAVCPNQSTSGISVYHYQIMSHVR